MVSRISLRTLATVAVRRMCYICAWHTGWLAGITSHQLLISVPWQCCLGQLCVCGHPSLSHAAHASHRKLPMRTTEPKLILQDNNITNMNSACFLLAVLFCALGAVAASMQCASPSAPDVAVLFGQVRRPRMEQQGLKKWQTTVSSWPSYRSTSISKACSSRRSTRPGPAEKPVSAFP